MKLDIRILGLAMLLCSPALGAGAQPVGFGPATEPPLQPDTGYALVRPEKVDLQLRTGSRFDGDYATQLAGAYLAGPTIGLALALAHPVVGLAFFALVAPAVHAAHGNGLAAALAVIGPTAATLSGFFFMSALQRNCRSSLNDVGRCLELPGLAGLIGYASWAVIDIVVHARRPHGAARARAAAPALFSF